MDAELRDSLEFLYADSVVRRKPCRSLTIDTARGGTVSVHVLLNGLTERESVRAVLRRGARAVPAARWFRLVDVPVEVNTGPVGFVEKGKERNRFVTRRAPFRVYDAMEPTEPVMKASSPVMAFRLHLPVSPRARAGRRDYVLEIQSEKEKHAFAVTVNVHKPVVPPVGRESFPYTNWFSFALMAQRHGLKPWGGPHWRMIRRYADLMVHARQNTFLCPLTDVFQVGPRGAGAQRGVTGVGHGRPSPTGAAPALDRARLRRIVKTFTDAGMYYIEGGHVARRTGGEWDASTFDLPLTGVRATSPEGNATLARITRQLMEEIESNGWRGRWIQHIADEPTETNAADYRILAGMVRKYMPGIPILDATLDTTIAGAVDIWCPQVQHYQERREHFEAQRPQGDRVWFYTCCFPGGPWLNRLLDMELLRPALFGWAAARYRLDGFLHWGLNHYRPNQDPLEQSVVDHGGGNFLPAGDTHIVYPGKKSPWSSVRLEAQREGFEDYELLRRLQSHDGRLADKIIRRAIRSFDRYTRNVGTFRSARKALLEALL